MLAAALLAQPAAASASKLIYQCHDDLCSIRPDGSGRERLTRDGHRMPYTDPSVSRDGRRLAFGHADARAPEISDARVRNRRSLDLHNHSVPMRPLMRPDGRVVMWARGMAVNSSTGLCTAQFTAPRRDRCQAYDHSYERAWGPRGSILLHWIEDNDVCRFSDRVQRPVFSPADQQYAAMLRVPTRGGRVRTIISERRGVGPPTWGR